MRTWSVCMVHPGPGNAPGTVHGELVPVFGRVTQSQRCQTLEIGLHLTGVGRRCCRRRRCRVHVGRQDVVEVELFALARAFAVAADEDDDGQDDRPADGGTSGDDDLVHVRRQLLLHADLAALRERHRLRRHVAVLQ